MREKIYFALTVLIFMVTAYTVVSYTLNKPTVFRTAYCNDSDGGDDIYVRGSIDGVKLVTGEQPTDTCLDYAEGTLVEYSCEQEGFYTSPEVDGLYSKSIKCDRGCKDGACIK